MKSQDNRTTPDAPDAANEARVTALTEALWYYGNLPAEQAAQVAEDIIAADPATSRIRALEEEIVELKKAGSYFADLQDETMKAAEVLDKKADALEEENRALREELNRFYDQ